MVNLLDDPVGSSALIGGRYGAAACTSGNKAWIYGRHDILGESVASFWEFDMVLLKWTRIGFYAYVLFIFLP